MFKACRKRGGDCPCGNGQCLAATEIQQHVDCLEREKKVIEVAITDWKLKERLLFVPLATLKDDFKFQDIGEPVIVFDSEEAYFGYEDAEGNWYDGKEWPFNQSHILASDCERLGIRVE